MFVAAPPLALFQNLLLPTNVTSSVAFPSTGKVYDTLDKYMPVALTN